MKRRNKKQHGFTLIEVMIAMMIFAMLSLLAYEILSASVDSSQRAAEQSERLMEVQHAVMQMERDITQILLRHETPESPFLRASSSSLQFSTIDSMNSTKLLSGSDIIDVIWQLSGSTLYRDTRILPSSVPDKRKPSHAVLENITDIKFRFYQGSWLESWNSGNALPAGIEVTLVLKDMGEIRRVFLLPEVLPAVGEQIKVKTP